MWVGNATAALGGGGFGHRPARPVASALRTLPLLMNSKSVENRADSSVLQLQDVLTRYADSSRVYLQAGRLMERRGFPAVFAEFAARRGEVALEISTLIQREAARPEETASTEDALHRWRIRLRDALSDEELDEVLGGCVRGEDVFSVINHQEAVIDRQEAVIEQLTSANEEAQSANERMQGINDATLAARAADLMRADRSRVEFLAMLAHELRNPLAPLRVSAAILQTPGAGAAVCGQAQGVMARQIDNMTRMIDDLLDASRITEGKIELRREVVPLEAVFNSAMNIAGPAIESRGQELTVILPDDPVFLHGDSTRLDQVFGNLLGNASKYSEPGGKISLAAERAEGEVIVRVRDHGIGIAQELLPHVFDLFVQATRESDRAYGGVGIGLTVVERLVALHHGSVGVQSEGLGRGSEFVVRLPILSGGIEPAPPPAVSPTDRSYRMLIVDDNEDAADTMALLQSLRGHQTRTAYNGPAALELAADMLPEVVLLDIGLPEMDGYEVARKLRAMPELDGVFLVAMTGYGSAEDRARSHEAGFDGHLVKPADLEVLRGWLRARE